MMVLPDEKIPEFSEIVGYDVSFLKKTNRLLRYRRGDDECIMMHFDKNVLVTHHNHFDRFVEVGFTLEAAEEIFSAFPNKDMCPHMPYGGDPPPLECHMIPEMTWLHPCAVSKAAVDRGVKVCRCHRRDAYWAAKYISDALVKYLDYDGPFYKDM